MPRTASIRILSGLIAQLALLLACPAQAADGLTVLHDFDNLVDGAHPYGRLVQGNDGAFYGTTQSGGGFDGKGEVYRVDTGGHFSILHGFVLGPDGYSPASGLALMDDGDFYGTTPQSCQGNPCTYTGGTVFRMAPDGTLTTLHVFTGSDNPASPGTLTAGRDGLLYGLTRYSGPARFGSAYAIATDGTYVPLLAFDGANGAQPQGALTEGADGNFYGTTYTGGAYGKGTVFRMTPDGAITTLHDFTGGPDGELPSGGSLLQGEDGRFYGGAGGGRGHNGIVFAITPDGALTTLHAFNGVDGTAPLGLVQGPDGDLYGASGGGPRFTKYGGNYRQGTLFRMSTSGRLTTLHIFKEADGLRPATAPIVGSDGRLYGTTDIAGTGGYGTVYAYDLAAPRVPELHICYYRGQCPQMLVARVGRTLDLEWSAANVVYCRASGAWSGVRATGGRLTLRLTRPGTFVHRIDCTGPDGHVGGQAVLKVIR